MSNLEQDDERRALDVLLEYFRSGSRGEWYVECRPDPPDFVIRRRNSTERVGVEVTRFEWPPRVTTWQWALRGLMTRVNRPIANQVEGQFLLSVDVPNQQTFSSHYKALSRQRREKTAVRLAQQIVAVAGGMRSGQQRGAICNTSQPR